MTSATSTSNGHDRRAAPAIQGSSYSTANVFGRTTQRIIVEVRVTSRSGGLRVAKQFADDRESQPTTGPEARVCVT